MAPSNCSILLFLVLFSFLVSNAFAIEVSSDARSLMIDGEHKIIVSGSIHYPRSTAEMWPDLIKKGKDGGLRAIETYVFWNAHEPSRRKYDFSGNLDLIRFLKTVQNEGLYAILRIGPYVCAEWNYGGFPVWLHNLPGCEIRTANDVFMNEMKNFTALIVDMAKQEKMFASQGGPIILAQIENEYGNVISSYGDAGKAYLNWCANMAESLDIGVPWIMCQEKDAPPSMIETCNGWYCDQYSPSNPNSPKLWTGWFKSWGGLDPLRTAEDLAYSVARFFQLGGTLQNYYMYHGGTNFGRTAGGPYITTSYDYNAPLDEFGNLNQPKWGHLKELHNVLYLIEKALTTGNISSVDLDHSVTATIYAMENSSACFLSNVNTTTDATVTFRGNEHSVPAWSVSILPDCKNEAYNTAKVNAQTSIMVKRSNAAEKEPTSLTWSWRPEINDKRVKLGSGHFTTNQILDQKMINDDSDYLWYMTSVQLSKDDPIWSDDMSLRVNGSGHILHAYVNGEYLGSEWAKYGVFNYVFEQKVKLNQGKNVISLLSSTVGLQNYGPMFDVVQTGILSPVELVGRKGDETVTKDLSAHKWSYHIGLHGFDDKLYGVSSTNWQNDNLPTYRNMTWYKTTFKVPLGRDLVVVDLLGMGKGMAWVNGNSIGRYWPSYIAKEDGCSTEACDYRGSYSNNKCVSNCGKPTQRWYHVPRSFMKDGENTLVLFEEFGGNPSGVNFQTVTVGSVCAKVDERKTMELACQNGGAISAVKFASFGDPKGVCGSYKKESACEGAKDALSIMEKACVGKTSCTIDVSADTFGSASCGAGVVKSLAVEAVC